LVTQELPVFQAYLKQKVPSAIGLRVFAKRQVSLGALGTPEATGNQLAPAAPPELRELTGNMDTE
jgi:hypothetical protein